MTAHFACFACFACFAVSRNSNKPFRQKPYLHGGIRANGEGVGQMVVTVMDFDPSGPSRKREMVGGGRGQSVSWSWLSWVATLRELSVIVKCITVKCFSPVMFDIWDVHGDYEDLHDFDVCYVPNFLDNRWPLCLRCPLTKSCPSQFPLASKMNTYAAIFNALSNLHHQKMFIWHKV